MSFLYKDFLGEVFLGAETNTKHLQQKRPAVRVSHLASCKMLKNRCLMSRGSPMRSILTLAKKIDGCDTKRH